MPNPVHFLHGFIVKKKKRGLRTKPEGIPDFQGIPEVQEFRNG